MKKNKRRIFKRFNIFYIILLVCIWMISVGYSALNSTLKISGIATARAKSDIRVISINSTRLDNGAYEKTTPRYTKYTTQIDSTLPNPNSIIEYTVTIKNYSDKQYEFVSSEITESNTDITLSIIGLAEGKIFEPGEEVSFVIKEMYTSGQGSNHDATTIVKYNFAEYIPEPEVVTTLLREQILSDNGGASAIEGKSKPSFSSSDKSNSGMHADTDDKGKTYYYRGNVTNNYVLFAGFYWRIVRINGDNSIKLIYQGKTANASGANSGIGTSKFNTIGGVSTSVTFYYSLAGLSSISTALNTWYGNNLTSYDDYIYKDSIFFSDLSNATSQYTSPSTSNTGVVQIEKKALYFGARYRLHRKKTPTFLIQNNDKHTATISTIGNKVLTYPIGLITLDEAYYAGGFSANNTSYYLNSSVDYWTISPYEFVKQSLVSKNYDARIAYITSSGKISEGNSDTAYTMRPVINLVPEVLWGGGTGTASDPYIPTLGNSQSENKVDPTPYYNSTLASALTSMSDAGDSTLLKHDSSLENGANDNNYRYSGPDPNNYVCFGDSSYNGSSNSTCPMNNLYRIIGVFDGKVKLISADYVDKSMLGQTGAYKSDVTSIDSTYIGKKTANNISKYAYTTVVNSDPDDNDESYINKASMTNKLGSTSPAANDWDDTSDLARENLNSIFLNKFSNDWKSKIVKTTWHVGDVNYFDSIKEKAKLVMDRELNSDATYSNYVGMMYYHEYAFAASAVVWKYSMNSYANYTKKNWMFLGLKEWTISHGSYTLLVNKITTYAAAVATSGAPGYEKVNNGLPIRVTFSIDTSVKLKSGKGTYDNPYALDIS